MAIVGLDEKKRQEAENESRSEMERLSARLKGLILSQPPQDLLGYNWRQLSMRPMFASEDDERTGKDKELRGSNRPRRT